MAKWIDVLRSTPWVLGLALLLATVSEAYHLHRCRSGSLARVLSQGSYSVSLNIGMVLFSVGLVLTARALPERLVCGGLGLFYSGRLIWRWRRRFGAAQPAPPRKGAQGKPATSADPHSRRCAAAWRVRLDLTEILAVALAALPLWFPDLRPGLTACALLLLAVVWLAVALLERSVWPRCSYDLALAVLLLMATVGALVSATPALTTPKVTGLILGLATYRVILRTGRDMPSLRKWALGMLALALAFAIAGLAFGEVRTKVPAIANFRRHLPLFRQALPGTQGGRVSTNQLGGTLLYVLPIGVALFLTPGRQSPDGRNPWRGGWLATAMVTPLLAAALLLTQSRGAWVAMLVGLLCILSLRWSWGKWVLLPSIAAFAGWLLWGDQALSTKMVQIVQGPADALAGPATLAWRIDVWARALSYIQDCPFTGYGLGTFRVVDTLFHGPGITGAVGTLNSSSGSIFDVGVPHAHNVFLQAAYDLGLPGLIAYVALLLLAIRMCWQVCRDARGVARAMGIGCLSSLVAAHVFGLTDVVALGAKPGVLWWALLALIAALHRTVTAK